MTTLLTNARLIDPLALTDTLGALVVADGKIAEILTQPVDNAETFPAGKVMGRGVS